MPFMPTGSVSLTPFATGREGPADPSVLEDKNSPKVGKFTHPSGAPDNHLLTVYSPGPVNHQYTFLPQLDGGIYLLKNGEVIEEPAQLRLIKNDPNYNESWPRAVLPRLDPAGLPEAVAYARRAVCTLLRTRTSLVHRLPTTETRRGGAWPSPRSWEMALRLVAFATAAGTSREVLSLLVRGTVGDGPGLELLASMDRMDLPDPEALLADPRAAVLPERGDLRQAVLDGVVAAVRHRPDRARWDAAWALLVRALETGPPDLVVVPASTLAKLREDDWAVPAEIDQLAGAVELSREAAAAGSRIAAVAGAG